MAETTEPVEKDLLVPTNWSVVPDELPEGLLEVPQEPGWRPEP